MTYRERKQARLARRLDWAAGRDKKAAQGFKKADAIASMIPMGQPVLVGHHSEGRHRRDLDRIDSGMRQGIESEKMAAEHRSKAAEIERQLDRSVYSDDPDALEALEARIGANEAKRARMKAENAAYRKGDTAFAALLGITLEQAAARRVTIEQAYSWCRQPHPAYELSNLGGRITADRKRLKDIKAQQARAQAAEQGGGVSVEYFNGREYLRFTFADKPPREILDALKAAGFGWGAGGWGGKTADVPVAVWAYATELGYQEERP